MSVVAVPLAQLPSIRASLSYSERAYSQSERARPPERVHGLADVSVVGTHSAVGAFWHHTLLHQWFGAYERYMEAEQHTVGKENTQKIESKHINLRTRIKRLVRRTICFSKTDRRHDPVIGLFINRYEFGVYI